MAELILQVLLSILCVFGAIFIKILICREIFFEKNGIIKTAVIASESKDVEKSLEDARKYYGTRVCVIFSENADEKEIQKLCRCHPKTVIYRATVIQQSKKGKKNDRRKKKRSR